MDCANPSRAAKQNNEDPLRMLVRHNAPLSFRKSMSVTIDTKSKSPLN